MKSKTMNFILILLGISVFIFTGVMILIYVSCGAVPDSLIYSFFAAVTGEAGFMSMIKSAKVKIEQKEQDSCETKATQEENHQGSV